MTDELRSQLALLLGGSQAHMTFDNAMAGFPDWAINERAPNVAYTPWQLVEHLRLTQLDMLRYIQDPVGYQSPAWPIGFWPDRDATTDAAGFAKSCDGFQTAGVSAGRPWCNQESFATARFQRQSLLGGAVQNAQVSSDFPIAVR